MRITALSTLLAIMAVSTMSQDFPDPKGATATTLMVTERFQRPFNTTAYAANELVSDSLGTPLVFENVARSNGGGGYVTGFTVTTNNPSTTNATFRLILFGDSISTGTTDTTAFNFSAAHDSTYLGHYDFALQTAGASSAIAVSSVTNWNHTFWTSRDSRHLHAILLATAAYTPIAGQWFSVRLHIQRL
jgi:hypothetical protein